MYYIGGSIIDTNIAFLIENLYINNYVNSEYVIAYKIAQLLPYLRIIVFHFNKWLFLDIS